MNFKDVEGIYKCDECKSHFNAQDVKLSPMDGFDCIMPPFTIRLIEKDGTIISSSNTSTLKDVSVLCCPKCGASHLFGFDKVSD